MIRFGPAGRDDDFYAEGYKGGADIAVFVNKHGLNAFEYQCNKGVRVNDANCLALKAVAESYGIVLSVHAPYYISMSGTDDAKRLNSVRYIRESAEAAVKMGADRIVFHTGSLSGRTREEALEKAKDTLSLCLADLKENGLYDLVRLCPETMGKINQLGTLEEVIELCSIDRRLMPCIDFGHLNARTLGGLRNKSDFDAVSKLLKQSGHSEIHCHFSMIEYTSGGEKQHLTFDDAADFYIDYKALIDSLSENGIDARIICESRGCQTRDAKTMMDHYTDCSR